MRKLAVTFCIVAIALGAILIYWISRQGELITEQRKQIDFLSSKIASNDGSDRIQLMKLDEECATQALRTFNDEKRDNFPKGLQGASGYENHYNRKRHKCFVLTQWQGSVTGVPESSKSLLDAFEHKTYATYYWSNTAGKKFWEVPPLISMVYSDGDESKGRSCASEAEFDEFVREYMND